MARKCARTEKCNRARAHLRQRQSLLEPGDFPEIIRAAPHDAGSSGPLRSLEDLERDAIKATLEATRYKIGRAAEILGISRKTLLEKRKKYHLLE